jgi:hypothetical protein
LPCPAACHRGGDRSCSIELCRRRVCPGDRRDHDRPHPRTHSRRPARQAAAWGFCTTAFALGQAIAGYGFAFIFARAGNAYTILFACGAAALLLALILDFLAGVTTPRRAIRG